MTDKIKMPTKLNNSPARTSRVPGSIQVAVAVLLGWASVAAQEAPQNVTLIRDKETDRVPAITAFPQYPSVARRDRIQGEATVCFNIRPNGKISRAIVTERSHRIFAKPALRAIKRSNFEPIAAGQVVAKTRACRIYRFRLDPILVRTNTPAKSN